MTTPTMDTPVREPKAESFLDWFRINSRLVTIAEKQRVPGLHPFV